MSTKLQITITNEEEKLLAEKAAWLGYDVTKYVKFLLSREANEQLVLSEKTRKDIKQAWDEYKKGECTVMSTPEDIDKYLETI